MIVKNTTNSQLNLDVQQLDVQQHGEVLCAENIQAWIVSYLAEVLEIDPDEIDAEIPFDQYGLDSAVAVGMTGDLEDWLGKKIDPTLLYDYPTIESFSRHLAEEIETAK